MCKVLFAIALLASLLASTAGLDHGCGFDPYGGCATPDNGLIFDPYGG